MLRSLFILFFIFSHNTYANEIETAQQAGLGKGDSKYIAVTRFCSLAGSKAQDENLSLCRKANKLKEDGKIFNMPLSIACVYPSFRQSQILCDSIKDLPPMPYFDGVQWPSEVEPIAESIEGKYVGDGFGLDKNVDYPLTVLCSIQDFWKKDKVLCSAVNPTKYLLMEAFELWSTYIYHSVSFNSGQDYVHDFEASRLRWEIAAKVRTYKEEMEKKGILEQTGKLKAKSIKITGRTDKTGDYYENMELSRRRALSIKSTLIRLLENMQIEIDPSKVTVDWAGESDAYDCTTYGDSWCPSSERYLNGRYCPGCAKYNECTSGYWQYPTYQDQSCLASNRQSPVNIELRFSSKAAEIKELQEQIDALKAKQEEMAQEPINVQQN